MKRSTARLIVCAFSNQLSKCNNELPSGVLEMMEDNLVRGNYNSVFDFFEGRLEMSIKNEKEGESHVD